MQALGQREPNLCAEVEDASWSRFFLCGAIQRHVLERLGDDSWLICESPAM